MNSMGLIQSKPTLKKLNSTQLTLVRGGFRVEFNTRKPNPTQPIPGSSFEVHLQAVVLYNRLRNEVTFSVQTLQPVTSFMILSIPYNKQLFETKDKQIVVWYFGRFILVACLHCVRFSTTTWKQWLIVYTPTFSVLTPTLSVNSSTFLSIHLPNSITLVFVKVNFLNSDRILKPFSDQSINTITLSHLNLVERNVLFRWPRC